MFMEKKFMTLWKFVCFRKIFRFLLHITIVYGLRKTAKFVYNNTRQSVATI